VADLTLFKTASLNSGPVLLMLPSLFVVLPSWWRR
jgi:hypothetical protein